MADTFEPRPLFGGAITVSLPSTLQDVSEIRQVPDNQEVYLDPLGFSSIVFDILERVEKPDLQALKLHLDDLVYEDAGQTKVWRTGDAHCAKLPLGTPVITLMATSPPGEKMRGRANEPEFVVMLLILIRLVEQQTDIIVAINAPHVKCEFEEGSVDLEHGKGGVLVGRAERWRDEVLRTFEVKDWGLFGGDGD